MPTILVIKDQAPIRENLLELLELEAYEAIGAEDGEVGVRLARETAPDWIICDVAMPRLDGFGVLAHLRRDSDTADISFFFLTATNWTWDMTEQVLSPADSYLSKPFLVPALVNAVRHSLQLVDSH
jgi:CheY-like chemotaxis protein